MNNEKKNGFANGTTYKLRDDDDLEFIYSALIINIIIYVSVRNIK